jgi:hypothetical protein
MLSLALAAALTSTQLSPAAEQVIRDTLHVKTYDAAQADLNGDGRPEILVYVKDDEFCGSGGCNLYILSPMARGYRVVLHTMITRPPIRRLATSTHGWRDIGVFVAGGGVKPHEAWLRFNGKRYPGNPSMVSATAAGAKGETLIGAPRLPSRTETPAKR